MLFTLCTLLNAIVCCLQLNTGRGTDVNLKVYFLGTDACWIAVCVLCRNAQMNLIVMLCTYQCCQLSSCNFFYPACQLSYWRDTTSELWTPVHSFTSEIQPTAIIVLFNSLQANIIFHTTLLILCFQQAGEIDNLTVSLGQSSLIVLCAGSTLLLIPWCCAVPHSATNNLQKTLDLLLVRVYLGFLLRENLLLHSSYLPLGVPNGRVT